MRTVQPLTPTQVRCSWNATGAEPHSVSKHAICRSHLSACLAGLCSNAAASVQTIPHTVSLPQVPGKGHVRAANKHCGHTEQRFCLLLV